MSLSREVLKWIQRLDLSYSVKNTTRDFSNGFLVAEIFSRFYDKDVYMHSFSNSTSMANKRDNWEQLMRFFRKRGVRPNGEDILESDINEIMQCKKGAVVAFLHKVYEFLTGRKVHVPPAPPADSGAPAFARATAAQAIRETLRDPGVDSITDLSTKESKMREALSQHQISMAEDKLRDPARYAKRNKIVRGSTRTVGREESKSSVEIKQVAVKSVDSNVAHLRATKELQASTARLTGTGAGITASRSVLPDFDAAGVVPVMATLGNAVTSVLTGRPELSSLDPTLPLPLAFVDQLTTSKAFPHAVGADVLRTMSKPDAVDSVSDACLMSPRDFYQVVCVFVPVVMQLPESSVAFAAAVDTLLEIGKSMMRKDNPTTVKLFRDFAMPSLAPLTKSHPTKRHGVLRLMYGFSANTPAGRLQAIRTLQQSLGDLTTFLHCLTVLIFLEDAFNDDLLDLYLYYTLIGMGMSSPSLRAACVAMLSVISAHNADVGPGVVDRLVTLQDDTWWEVKAQLLIVASALLQRMTPATDSSSVKTLLALVVRLIHPDNGPVLLRVGVSYISPLVRSHPGLLSPYLRALLALPSAARVKLLSRDGPRDQLPVWGVSGGKYRLPCAAASWPADVVCREFTTMVAEDHLEHLDVEHFEVLAGLLRSGDATAPPTTVLSAAVASEAFAALQNHLFVGLVDPECCAAAIDVLQAFMDIGLGVDVVAAPPLEGTLVLLHRLPEGELETQCQELVAGFLRSAASRGPSFSAAVSSQLTTFKAAFADPIVPCMAELAAELGV